MARLMPFSQIDVMYTEKLCVLALIPTRTVLIHDRYWRVVLSTRPDLRRIVVRERQAINLAVNSAQLQCIVMLRAMSCVNIFPLLSLMRVSWV